MKNVYCVSTKQHRDMKSGVLESCDPKMHSFCKRGVLVHCLARMSKKSILTDT